CLVELAFDQGALRAGDRRWRLCELEFELKGGEAGAMAALAARWVARFGLTLDIRTKSERGERLARGVRLGAPVKAQALRLPEDVDSQAGLRAVVGHCLAQVLGNASEIAHEDDTAPEHLHQLRVGLRRLRTALRELGELAPQAGAGWGDALAQLFARLGSARDRDALAQTLLPALQKAGASGLELPTIEAEPAAQLALRDIATTQLWLELLAFAAGTGLSGEAFAPLLQTRLTRLWRQVRRDAARFDSLDDEARHRLRKRVKRLRYLSDFAASLYRPKDVKAFQARLAPTQEALGAFNDVCVARALFEPEGLEDSLAMFALGWLAHERDDCIARSVRALAALRKAKPFW
ncbi:MAG: CHAD domain-containing protein, partial [Rubrivivax sp.]